MSRTTLDQLVTRGFDLSIHAGDGMVLVKCSQCETLVINGVATHEHGCPNQTHECKGCNAIIPARQRYCEDCQ